MYDESEYSSWHLKGDFGEEVILQITDFDIGCETGSDLEISDGNRLVHYCNKNRPVYPIYGLYEIDIQFHINLCGSRILVEGFRGNYSVVESKSQTFKSMTSLYEEGKETYICMFSIVYCETLHICSTKISRLNENGISVLYRVVINHGYTF